MSNDARNTAIKHCRRWSCIGAATSAQQGTLCDVRWPRALPYLCERGGVRVRTDADGPVVLLPQVWGAVARHCWRPRARYDRCVPRGTTASHAP